MTKFYPTVLRTGTNAPRYEPPGQQKGGNSSLFVDPNQMVNAVYKNAMLIDTMPKSSKAYSSIVLRSIELLLSSRQYENCCACLVTVLNDMPTPLNKYDGLFLLGYMQALHGKINFARLNWRQCIGKCWSSKITSPDTWHSFGRSFAAAEYWFISSLLFGEAVPSQYSLLNVVVMPICEPDSDTLIDYLEALSHIYPPSSSLVNDIIAIVMCCSACYHTKLREQIVEIQPQQYTDLFARQHGAVMTLTRWYRQKLMWRYQRALYWVHRGVRGFMTYRKPTIKKRKSKIKKLKCKQISAPLPPNESKLLDEVDAVETCERQQIHPLPPTEPPINEISDFSKEYADKEVELEERLRFILHRARAISSPTKIKQQALTLENTTPTWLKQLSEVREIIHRDGYITKWKAGVLRTLGTIVQTIESSHGSTDCSRYIHKIIQDISKCHVQHIYARMDSLLKLANEEEGRRNLAFFHLRQQELHD